ncbi:hypothetical protein DIPPA_01075 [Diplonema papillatum]|nr:hypothetical protein DIPPA_01075 [Diplonema papillatum]
MVRVNGKPEKPGHACELPTADLRFSGSGKKRGNATKRKRHKGGESRDEKTVIVRVNDKPEGARVRLSPRTSWRTTPSTASSSPQREPRCLTGNRHHDDGILVTNLNLVTEADTLYAAPPATCSPARQRPPCS